MLGHVLDGVLVILPCLSVVTHLHHDRANVRQADALLLVVLVELRVNVVGVRVTE